MKFLNLNEVSDYRVEKWIEEKIPELTQYQKEYIRDHEIVRFAPFQFYEHNSPKGNFLWRLTIFPLIPVWVVLFCTLPIKYILTGVWGYNKIDWYKKWTQKIGL